ncbi:MAG TPA: tetratricopeptide repeat protein [Rhodocyclaceae bacterium]|nr:tetratricopeptide repeat protein [Rhodocyclaceae bacterium]
MKPQFSSLRISSLLGALLLSVSLEGMAIENKPADAPNGLFAKPPVTELTPQILYQFMFAEIAGTRGQVPLSVAAYLDLAQTTQDPRIAKRAAEVALHARQYDAALAATRLWVEREPASAAAQQMAVTLAAAFGRLDEVALHLPRALELDGANVPATLMRLNRLLARVEDKAAVYSVIEQATTPYLNLPEAHFARAQAAYAAKNIPRAQADINQALALRPDWEFAVLFKALLVQNQPDEVVTVLQSFVKANPQANDARLGLARALVAQKRFDEALTEFKRVLQQQPDNADVIYAVGLLSLQLQDYPTAEAQFTRLVDMGYIESNVIRTYLGQMAEDKRDLRAAAAWYAGVTPSAQYMSAQSRAALLTARAGDLAGARAILQKVTVTDEASRTQMKIAEAQLLREANQHEAAYALLDKALAAQPDDPDLLYETALSADRLHKYDTSDRLLQRLIKNKPDHAHAYNALGYSWAERGVRLDEAQQMIDKALTILPGDPFILDSKGWVLFRKGDGAAALTVLQQAFAKRADPEIAAHLGEVLWSLGRQPDARKVWADAARANPSNEMLAETIKKFLP